MNGSSGATKHEWREGWPVVLASAVGIYLSVIHIYSLGLFIQPLEQEFGWTREQITAGSLIVSLFSFVLNPFIGRLLDRLSVRWVAIPGVIAYCACFAGLGLVGPGLASWWLGWVLLGLAFTGVNTTVWMLAAASRFDKRRGMALAFVLLGTGAAGATVPLFANLLVNAFGWRAAYAAFGGLGLLVALPSVFFMLHDARSHARRGGLAKADAVALTGLGLRQSVSSPRFWKLAVSSVAAVIGILGLTVHFVPILSGKGIDRDTAAAVAGAVGVGGIAGRLLTGFCLDRFHGAIVGAVAFALPMIACLLLQTANEVPAFVAAAVILGLSLGAEVDVVAYLTTRYFGMLNYGVVFGALSGCLTLGAGFGPFIAGVAYDRLGDYVLLERVLMATFLISALLILSLGRYPQFGVPPQSAGAPPADPAPRPAQGGAARA